LSRCWLIDEDSGVDVTVLLEFSAEGFSTEFETTFDTAELQVFSSFLS
jgi:hypothetical protein